MNNQDLAYQVLTHFFPNECAIIGDSDVMAIASGIDKTVETTGGSNMDISEIIKLLIEAAGLVKIILETRTAVKTKGEIPQQKNEMISDKISTEKIDEIHEYLLKEMESKKMGGDGKK